jgi:hypothetical protein
MATTLPAHRVRAHNEATQSENRIHDDTVARQYGFRGGLVPGVTVYAYHVTPAAAALGMPWVEGGRMSARFALPVYEGDDVVVSPSWSGDDGLDLSLAGPDGDVRATATASVSPDPGDIPDIPAAPLSEAADRPPASEESLAEGTVLGTLELGFHADAGGEFLDLIGDDLPLWRDEGVAHPGWLLRQANYVLSSTVRLGPWIHVSSDARHLRAVRDGQRVEVRGRVARLFERKGHRFVDLDVVYLADGAPALHVLHTAIWQPRRPTP